MDFQCALCVLTDTVCCLCSGSRDQSVIVWDVESFARKNTVAITEVVLFVWCMTHVISRVCLKIFVASFGWEECS